MFPKPSYQWRPLASSTTTSKCQNSRWTLLISFGCPWKKVIRTSVSTWTMHLFPQQWQIHRGCICISPLVLDSHSTAFFDTSVDPIPAAFMWSKQAPNPRLPSNWVTWCSMLNLTPLWVLVQHSYFGPCWRISKFLQMWWSLEFLCLPFSKFLHLATCKFSLLYFLCQQNVCT